MTAFLDISGRTFPVDMVEAKATERLIKPQMK